MGAGFVATIPAPAATAGTNSSGEDDHPEREEQGEPQHAGTDAARNGSGEPARSPAGTRTDANGSSTSLLPAPLVTTTASNQPDRENELGCELVPGGYSSTDYDGDGNSDSIDDDDDCDYLSDGLEGNLGTGTKDRDTDDDGDEDFEDMDPLSNDIWVEVEVTTIDQSDKMDCCNDWGDPFFKYETGIGFHGLSGVIDRTMTFADLTEGNHQHDCQTCWYYSSDRTPQDLPDNPSDSFYDDSHVDPWDPPEVTYHAPLWDHDAQYDDEYTDAEGFTKSLYFLTDQEWDSVTVNFQQANLNIDWRTSTFSCSFPILERIHEFGDGLIYPGELPSNASGGECEGW